MKWLKRIALALLIVVIVSGVALIVMVRFLPETDFIRNAVEQRLRDLTGQNIAIASIELGGSFPDLMRITVQGVTATSQDGQKQLSMNRLVLVPSVAPLLHREISIESVNIEGLHTSLTRLADGSVRYPFVVAPVSSPVRGPERIEEPAGPGEQVPKEKPEAARGGLTWSIKSVKLTDCRIDFIDEQTAQEGEGPTVISLKTLNASLSQQKEGNAFAISLRAQMKGAKAEAGPVGLTGDVTLTGDLSQLQQAKATLTSESLRLEPFQRFLPPSAEILSAFRLSGVHCTMTWEKAQPCAFSFEGNLNGKGENSGAIALKGEGRAAEDFSLIQNVTIEAKTEGFPLRAVQSLVPRGVPWETSSGLLSANVRGEWRKPSDWTVQGQVSFADLASKGAVAALGKKMGVKAQISLDPRQLTVQDMEVAEAKHRLATVSGKVQEPLSGQPTLDLTADCTARPQWLKAFGVRLPETVNIAGYVPVRVRVKGPTEKMSIDVNANLAPAAIRVSPFVEKPEGEKASLTVQTTLTEAHRSAASKAAYVLRVGLYVLSPHIRLKADGAPLTGRILTLTSRVIVKGKSVDIRDAVLTLKRPQRKSSDDLVIQVDMADLESGHPKLKGTLAAFLHKETISALLGNLPSNLKLSGEAHGKLTFSGNPKALDWNLELPLTSLGIDVEKSFRKPAGVAADFKASGKWAQETLNLERSRLTLPGIYAVARGVLKERKGGFGGLKVRVKRADLKDVARLLPSLAKVKVSGPVEADLELKPSQKGIVPHASVRLVSADYHADNSAWILSKLRGVVKFDGQSLRVPELTGNIRGAIEAPLKVTGNLQHIDNVEQIGGRVSLEMGKGRIRAERFRKLLQPVQLLVGTLLDPKALAKRSDLLELESLTGTFDIKSGIARTSDIQLKGPDFKAGAMGTIRLRDMHLDALAGLHTVIVTNDSIGRIPQVRSVVKKYEGFLKATGLDKELKKVGIDVDAKKDDKQTAPKEIKTPVTVIVKVQGAASSPNVMPVPEDSLGKEKVSKLKSLIN